MRSEVRGVVDRVCVGMIGLFLDGRVCSETADIVRQTGTYANRFFADFPHGWLGLRPANIP